MTDEGSAPAPLLFPQLISRVLVDDRGYQRFVRQFLTGGFLFDERDVGIADIDGNRFLALRRSLGYHASSYYHIGLIEMSFSICYHAGYDEESNFYRYEI